MIEEIVRKNFELVDENEEVKKIFGYIYGEKEFPIVTRNKKAFGVIDERSLIKSKILGNEKIKNFAVGVPKIDATYSLNKAREVMIKSGSEILIVTSEKEIVGYIRLIDILREVGVQKTARDVMKYVEPLDERDTVSEAINVMRRSNRKFIPVLSNKKFSGVVGVRKILPFISTKEKSKGYAEKTSLLETVLAGLVDEIPVCKEDKEISKIIDFIEESNAVAVCRGNEYLGLIEEVDLL